VHLFAETWIIEDRGLVCNGNTRISLSRAPPLDTPLGIGISLGYIERESVGNITRAPSTTVCATISGLRRNDDHDSVACYYLTPLHYRAYSFFVVVMTDTSIQETVDLGAQPVCFGGVHRMYAACRLCPRATRPLVQPAANAHPLRQVQFP